MIEVLSPQHSSHLMCSQNVNNLDLSSGNDHPSTLNFGTENNNDSSSRQDYTHSPAQPLSQMGLQFMTLPPDDVRFSSDTTSHSPVYSIDSSAIHNTPLTSTLGYGAYSNVYQPTQNLSPYSTGNGGSSFFSPSAILSMPDTKPRINSLSSSSVLPYSRPSTSSISNLTTPLSARDIYSSHTPFLSRRPPDLINRSPPLSLNALRSSNLPLSPATTPGFASPISLSAQMDPSGISSPGGAGTDVPPLESTEVLCPLTTSSGEQITPEIFGRIDKGFFQADGDWTCYRRNYFSLACSYTLHPTIPHGSIYLQQTGGTGPQVHGFAMSIAAVVDGREGKPIDLVQHTPKRDKGPQDRPARIPLSPKPPTSHHSHLPHHSHHLYSEPSSTTSNFSTPPSHPAIEAIFERIQFKNATANNGKRRAAQQYYHLLVELFADLGNSHPDRWIKVASRISAPMVVRGRSPGHYQSERRESNAGGGGGGSANGGNGGYGTPGGSVGSGGGRGDVTMSGTSSMLPGSSYGGHDSNRYYSRLPHLPLNIPLEPILSQEEAKSIEESPCYLYYPTPIWEQGESRTQLPTLESKGIKNEYGSGTGYTLPSLSSDFGTGSLRGCGRFEGVSESRGYYPTAMVQGEM